MINKLLCRRDRWIPNMSIRSILLGVGTQSIFERGKSPSPLSPGIRISITYTSYYIWISILIKIIMISYHEKIRFFGGVSQRTKELLDETVILRTILTCTERYVPRDLWLLSWLNSFSVKPHTHHKMQRLNLCPSSPCTWRLPFSFLHFC